MVNFLVSCLCLCICVRSAYLENMVGLPPWSLDFTVRFILLTVFDSDWLKIDPQSQEVALPSWPGVRLCGKNTTVGGMPG